MAPQLQLANFWGKKRKNASDIWDHFGFATNDKGSILDRTKAVCKYCNAKLKYQGGSTSILQYFNSYHMKSVSVKATQPSIADSFGKPKKYSVSNARQTLLQRCVAEYLTENLVPFSTVENKSFINLMKILDPKFNVGTRRTYTDVIIPKLYIEVKEKVNSKLKPAEGVACTTDGWTSIATESYITLTCHFIDNKWDMNSFCLETRHHPESHTAENLKCLLDDAFSEWKLNEKCITGFVDNARNIINAWQLMDKQHILCFAHTMNLAVKKGLEEDSIGGVLGKCRRLISHFNHSDQKKQALKA